MQLMKFSQPPLPAKIFSERTFDIIIAKRI